MNPHGHLSTEALYTSTLLIYIYIYRERERERERDSGDRPSPVNRALRPCIPLHCSYIYIYIREIDPPVN